MTHTVPTVGVTHDIVIYPGGSQPPVGLVLAPFTYRLGISAPLLPRMAAGADRGMDYSTFMSWVQDSWDGRSGLEQADGTGYRTMTGFYPVLPGYSLQAVPYPRRVRIGDAPADVNGDQQVNLYSSPYARAPSAVHNVATSLAPSGTYWPSGTRLFMGGVIGRPSVAPVEGGTWVIMDVVNTLNVDGETVYARDAVSYSTTAIISTYAYTVAGVGNTVRVTPPRPLLCHAYESIWKPEGSTTAGALAVYDRKLWRAEPSGDRIAYYTPTGTSNQYWSDWITITPGTEINSMCEFIGRLMVGCYDGLYAYEAGRTYLVVDFSNQASVLNFTMMASISGSLWFNIQARVFRYTSGGLLEELDTNFEDGEFPVSVEGGRNCVYISTASFMKNYRSVYRIDIGTGATARLIDLQDVSDGNGVQYNPLLVPVVTAPDAAHWELDEAEYLTNPILVAPVITSVSSPGPDPQQLAIGAANFGAYPEAVFPYLHHDWKGYFATGMVKSPYPAVNKSWQRIRFTAVVPKTTSINVVIGYRTLASIPYRGYPYGESLDSPNRQDWTYIGPQGFSNNTTINLRSYGLLSKQIEFSPIFTGYLNTTVATQVAIESMELDYLLAGPTTDDGNTSRLHTFRAVVTDGLELWNGEVENSAAWVTAMIYSIADSRVPHVVAFPYPPPQGHTAWATIEIAQGGVAVPVLSYQNVSCAGSDLSLGIREV